jgi:hypothetical protein
MAASAEEAREVQLSRNEMMLSVLEPLVNCENPDLKAMELVLKIGDRQAKLLGLYESRPSRTDTAVAVPNLRASEKADEIQRFMDLLAKADPYALAQLTGAAARALGRDEQAGFDDDLGVDDLEASDASDIPELNEVNEDDEPEPLGHWFDGRFIPDDLGDIDGAPGQDDEAAIAAVERAFSMSE